MLEETEEYVMLLTEESRLKEVEETYVWLFTHKMLSEEKRAEYGYRIFDIDTHYNPYSNIVQIFPQLVKMTPQSPNLL